MFPVWEQCVKDNVEWLVGWLVGSVGLECVVPDAEHSGSLSEDGYDFHHELTEKNFLMLCDTSP